MAQFKIYGQAAALESARERMSRVIHDCAVTVLQLPATKRFHRFFPMTAENFPTPDGRSERYTIIEIAMFAGRSVETKKALYRALYTAFERELGIAPVDLEIAITETPKHDWGIRGLPADELQLNYTVEV